VLLDKNAPRMTIKFHKNARKKFKNWGKKGLLKVRSKPGKEPFIFGEKFVERTLVKGEKNHTKPSRTQREKKMGHQ